MENNTNNGPLSRYREFVYGNLKSHCTNNRDLKGSRRVSTYSNLVHMYKNSIYLTVKTFNRDFSPYIKNDVHIMGSHFVSTLKAHDL